jgi:hypothetical protein
MAMRMGRLSVGAALAGVMAVSAAAVASSAGATTYDPLVTVDEAGHGALENLCGPGCTMPMPGVLAADPGPGGSASALTYDLLGPPSITAGDVLIYNSGVLEDVVRFNDYNTGGVAGYPASLVFYALDGSSTLAGGSGAPTADYTNQLSLTEVGHQLLYTPSAGQPGYVSGFDAAYLITSGTPEPGTWAMLILGIAMIGLVARHRSQGASAAA